MKLLIEKVYQDAIIPIRTTEYSSGYDLFIYKIVKIFSYHKELVNRVPFSDIKTEKIYEDIKDCDLFKYIIKPNERILVDTGIRATVGNGFEIQIRSRSGLALKQGLVVENSPGTIDADYRGNIGIILINDSFIDREICQGDRIAQMVIQKVEMLDIEIIDKLPDIGNRGEGGFGSTGV